MGLFNTINHFICTSTKMGTDKYGIRRSEEQESNGKGIERY